MTAPALPEIFGNYVLGKDFVEVVSPDSISWLPQTVGWVWVGAGLLVLAGYRAWKYLQYWYRNRYRGEALAQLKSVSTSGSTAAEVNRLLKLTALAAFSREQVASLSGEQWVHFLNLQCPEPVFDAKQQNLLAQAPYSGAPVTAPAGNALIQASVLWVQQHKNAHDV